MNDIEQLQQQVAELMAWKKKKETQQAIELVLGLITAGLLLAMVGWGVYQLRNHG